MTPTQGYVFASAAVALGYWLYRGQWEPSWGVVAAIVAAITHFVLTRPRRVPFQLRPPRIAIVIPTKDNITTVADVARRAATYGMRVYVVDDGSIDGSGEACQGVATVLTHPVNLGKGRALLTAMRAALAEGFTHIICLDADGQHSPDDIPAFRDAILAEPEAIIVGVRDLSTAPGRSQFGRKFSNFWIWFETGWRVGDSQCGYRAYPIGVVLNLPLGGHRYDLEVEVLTRALWAGVPVRDVPCWVYYPPKEERVSSFRPFVDNTRISLMNARLVVGRILWPPRWFPRIRSRAWDGRSRGFAGGWQLVLWTLRTFGAGPAYAFVSILALYYRVFGVTPGIRAWLAASGGGSLYTLYRNFAVALIDRLLFILHGPDAFDYQREGGDHLLNAFTGTRGAILLTAHVGNTEVSAGGGAPEERVKRLAVLRFDADVDHGRDLLAGLPQTWIPRFISVNRSEGFSTLSVLRELRSGAVVAMHGDRVVDDRSTTVEFCGRPMKVPVGPYMLAALADVPIVIIACFKEGPRAYRTISLPPRSYRFERGRSREVQLQEWAQAYIVEVEKLARRYPLQWYNFHDVWA